MLNVSARTNTTEVFDNDHASISNPVQCPFENSSPAQTDSVKKGPVQTGPIENSSPAQFTGPSQFIGPVQSTCPVQLLAQISYSGPGVVLLVGSYLSTDQCDSSPVPISSGIDTIAQISLQSDAVMVLTGDSSSSDPSILQHTSHPMVTRSKIGTIKPNLKYALVADNIPSEPLS
ncbi:hypothetical protein NE237_002595 [Protea cynaroides]|uniref:Uncharacterized protein n=1 Tax=Protea cynaroides TaxID=273540 RepID=A0A9Q0QZI6_9MAGN|nr:hypothetical protein NE237_002595 [Protea cynaroides]